jgi:hypothetical protein
MPIDTENPEAYNSTTMKANFSLFEKKCLRCGHRWLPRIATRIRRCPNCSSQRWDTRRDPSKAKPGPKPAPAPAEA